MTSTVQDADPAQLDFANPQVMECPYPIYESLREKAPVYFAEKLGFWLITRYDDCLNAIRDPQVFSSKMGFRPGAVPDEVMRIYNEEGFGDLPDTLVSRSEERRVGKEGGSTGRLRGMAE